MTILILTDSLGSPRKETRTEELWTYNIIKKYSNSENVFFTIIRHGLHVSEIPFEQIENMKPDIILCQIGIVDCCRRALPDGLKALNIHLIGGLLHRLAKKHHYLMTKLFNFRSTEPQDFSYALNRLMLSCVDCRFIRIADAGKILREKTFHCQEDIDTYNKLIMNTGKVIDPYEGYSADEYVLNNDGHHLNMLGHKLVYKHVDDYLQKVIRESKNSNE